jgi:DNA-binding transcriptional ArsR family regulator
VSRKAAGIDRTLAALADPHRRRVVELLRERPHRAGELAQRTGLALPAMSHPPARECAVAESLA